jgi:error-prone DNA polymerase
LEFARGLIVIILPPEDFIDGLAGFEAQLAFWVKRINSDLYLAASHLCRGRDRLRIAALNRLAKEHGLKLVAVNDVLMAEPDRRMVADVLTCMREKCTIDALGRQAQLNGERHLKSPAQMAQLFEGFEHALAATIEIANAVGFSLDDIAYQYPTEAANNPMAQLSQLVAQGARIRYPHGLPDKVSRQLAHELDMIAELKFAPYFLTIADIVRFARDQEILHQGRGSAANSAVCYVLGITEVDPACHELLFERFVSPERGEPPDIDVDFEHERREEIIQYIYRKYGRHRAGMTATVQHFRPRGALRETGKALGLSDDVISSLNAGIWGGSSAEVTDDERLKQAGLDPADTRLALTLEIARQMVGLPRHLGQHVGGFVITRDRLDEIVPVENAAMADRTVIEWDKNDIDALNILKVDILGLGMLTCLRKGFDLLARHYGRHLNLANLPAEDETVYDMLCSGDSIGVFQVESRAQMAFLPRMKPRCFYDLVIEVAIVRPGPIQGDMVHPYIRRRNGEEPVEYASPELEQVLKRTLGVPLFQEQAMQIAIVAAGFTPPEADKLRRAMATFRRMGTIHTFRQKMIDGMAQRGYERAFAERCFKQIEGFGEYGFPESHAASFAHLVYASAWMKNHYPDAFAAALLNAQPMGFYAPAQIIRDAREHGVEIRPVDVNASTWDHTLEPNPNSPYYALRVGLRQIKGLSEDDADWLVAARGNGYREPADIWRRAGLARPVLEKLANSDAFSSLDLSRRPALWQATGLGPGALPLFQAAHQSGLPAEQPVQLPEMPAAREVVEDYAALRLSLKDHPLRLIRHELGTTLKNGGLVQAAHNSLVTVCGLVIARQRPGTAKGVIFMTLEDDTGVANIIVWPKIFETFRRVVIASRLVRVTGQVQREGLVVHVIARKVEDLSHLLDAMWHEPGRTAPSPAAAFKHKPAPRARRHPREQAKALFPSRDFH